MLTHFQKNGETKLDRSGRLRLERQKKSGVALQT